jgi:hypothetical protein
MYFADSADLSSRSPTRGPPFDHRQITVNLAAV